MTDCYFMLSHYHNHFCRLQDFVDELSSGFIREAPELMKREFEREGVKLHATVMNSKFLEVTQEGSGGALEVHRGRRRQMSRARLDATGVFQVCFPCCTYLHTCMYV